MRYLVGLATSVLLFILFVRTIDLGAVAGALGTADVRLVPLAVVPFFMGVWVRSIRWRLLLPERRLSTRDLFRVQVVGFAINNVVPARAGDLARAYLLARWCNVSYGTTAASLIVERIVDGLTLACILLAVLAFVPAPGYLLVLAGVSASTFVVLTVLAALAVWRESTVIWLVSPAASCLPPAGRPVLLRLANSFAHGLLPLRAWRRIPAVLGLSVLAWVCQFGLFFILMFAFPLPASLALTFLGGSVANFATLIPSSPGSVGTFEGALVKVLVDVAGANPGTAAAYALIVHATLFIPVIVLGVAIVWRANISVHSLLKLPMRGNNTSSQNSTPALSVDLA